MERTLITVPNAISMVAVVGPHDDNLRVIEAAFPSVNITVRGNEITLRGPHADCARLENLFNEMMVVIRSGNCKSKALCGCNRRSHHHIWYWPCWYR